MVETIEMNDLNTVYKQNTLHSTSLLCKSGNVSSFLIELLFQSYVTLQIHVFYSQKEIYRSGKITGGVRILKGQEVLPDDSTLAQHNISDGDTVNIIIEPAKQITVEVVCKWGTFKHAITSSILVKDLKQKLIDSGQVAFLPNEYDFKGKISDSCVKTLKDDAFPIQHYGIQNDCQLVVVKPYLFLTLMSEDNSRKVHRKIPTITTVHELNMMIKEQFCDEKVIDIILFVTNDQIKYGKVASCNGMLVGDVLSDDQTVCYLENKYEFDSCYVVKHQDVEIGRVYGARGDTVSIIKLRVQNQLGISANCLTVTKSVWVYNVCKEMSTRENEKIGDLEITISVHATWDNSQLPIVRPYLFLTLMSQDQYKKEYKKVLKKVTMKELENMVLRLFCGKNVNDISLFVTNDQIRYVKVGPNKDVSIGEVLSDNQTVCYLVNKSDYYTSWPVKNGDVEIGRVYGDKEDTKKIVQLRVQDQLGIPANRVKVASSIHEIQIDGSLPLHEYGINDDGKLIVDRSYLFLTLMNKDQSEKTFKKLPKETTTMELKKLIVKLFCDPNVTGDISLYVAKDDTKYFKVCPK